MGTIQWVLLVAFGDKHESNSNSNSNYNSNNNNNCNNYNNNSNNCNNNYNNYTNKYNKYNKCTLCTGIETTSPYVYSATYNIIILTVAVSKFTSFHDEGNSKCDGT